MTDITMKYVNSRQELKQSLAVQEPIIAITDKELAKHVTTVKRASRTAFATAIASAIFAVTCWWNPLGWVAVIVAGGTTTALAIAVVFFLSVMTASYLQVLWGSYVISNAIVKEPNVFLILVKKG